MNIQIFDKHFKSLNPHHKSKSLTSDFITKSSFCAICTPKEALELRNQMIHQAMEIYTKQTGKEFLARNFEWVGVVKLESKNTMADLKKLALHFNQTYGFQCYQIAIHKDEGYFDKKEKIINHYAYLEFITLDKQTGKNNFRKIFHTPKMRREIQIQVAEILRIANKRGKIECFEFKNYTQIQEQESNKITKLKADYEKEIAHLKSMLELEELESNYFFDESIALFKEKEQILKQHLEYKEKELLRLKAVQKAIADIKAKDKE